VARLGMLVPSPENNLVALKQPEPKPQPVARPARRTAMRVPAFAR